MSGEDAVQGMGLGAGLVARVDGESASVARSVDTLSGGVGVTPLTLHEWSSLKGDEVGKYWEIRGGENLPVDYGTYTTCGFSLSGWIPEGAAEFIVRAGNNHAPLVSALADLLAWIEEEDDNREGTLLTLEATCNQCTQGSTPINFDKGPCVYHKARAALAAASPGTGGVK
jgi:hypothetical protein